jgi:hypothetical protein
MSSASSPRTFFIRGLFIIRIDDRPVVIILAGARGTRNRWGSNHWGGSGRRFLGGRKAVEGIV